MSDGPWDLCALAYVDDDFAHGHCTVELVREGVWRAWSYGSGGVNGCSLTCFRLTLTATTAPTPLPVCLIVVIIIIVVFFILKNSKPIKDTFTNTTTHNNIDNYNNISIVRFKINNVITHQANIFKNPLFNHHQANIFKVITHQANIFQNAFFFNHHYKWSKLEHEDFNITK